MNRYCRYALGALVGLGFVGTPFGVSAENWDRITDELTFNGAQCTFADSGATSGQDRNFGKLQNNSGSTETAICPISRTRTISKMGGASILTSFGVNPDSCRLRVRSWATGSYQTFLHSDTINLGGNMQVRWGFGANGYEIGGNSSVTIACDLPHGSPILTYTFDSPDLYYYF